MIITAGVFHTFIDLTVYPHSWTDPAGNNSGHPQGASRAHPKTQGAHSAATGCRGSDYLTHEKLH